MLLEGCRILPGEGEFACRYLALNARFQPLWAQTNVTGKSCLMHRTYATPTVHQAKGGSDIGLSQTALGQCNCCVPGTPIMHAILVPAQSCCGHATGQASRRLPAEADLSQVSGRLTNTASYTTHSDTAVLCCVCLTPDQNLLQLADACLLAVWHGHRGGKEGKAEKHMHAQEHH